MKNPPAIRPFDEHRQIGDPRHPDDQVYRTIGLTAAQLDRLPMWAKLAIARADATIIRRDNTINDLLAALETLQSRWCGDNCRLRPLADVEDKHEQECSAARAAITASKGEA